MGRSVRHHHDRLEAEGLPRPREGLGVPDEGAVDLALVEGGRVHVLRLGGGADGAVGEGEGQAAQDPGVEERDDREDEGPPVMERALLLVTLLHGRE